MNLANPLLAETAALEANRVQPVGLHVAGGGSFGKGKNVAGDGRPAADKRVRTDANEVMHGAECAYLGPLADRDVATESGRIGQDDVVSDFAIMSNVSVSHDQDVAAHAGQSAAFHRAAI